MRIVSLIACKGTMHRGPGVKGDVYFKLQSSYVHRTDFPGERASPLRSLSSEETVVALYQPPF